ncbi:MAG: hypothetical protein AAF694_10745 [Bacteroidota bacterium]
MKGTHIVLTLFFLSLWEIGFSQTIAEQITELNTVVTSLPTATPAEQVKKAVLELALERATNAATVSYNQEAEDLIRDVLSAIDQPASEFIERNPKASHLNGFGPILTPEDNPYLEGLVNSAANALASPDKEFPRTTPSQPVYNDLGGTYGTRSAPSLSRNYFWLFAHEQSPMRFHPELIKRVLRRMHTFADLVSLDPYRRLGSPFNLWYDQFAMEYAFPAFYEIVELHPHILLPSQKRAWDNMMQAARSAVARGNGDVWRAPWNYNIETARMLGVLNIGLYLNDQEIVERVLRHADKAMKMQRLDGAMPYHGDDRPSVNYHNVVYGLWLQMYEQTGYEPFRYAIEKSQWKGSTTGRTEEWWTSPFDKAYRWNIQKGTEAGVEAVATFTENPYVRGLIDRNQQLTGVVSGKLGGKDAAVWYNPNIPLLPLPNSYTIPDRNIGGPRAWYGDFTYAGSFRPWSEGHRTLIGAMTVEPEDGQLNSILAEVTPKVWITPEGENSYSAFAELTDKEISATTISRHYSIGATLHGMKRSRGGSYAGPLSEWKGRQIWIGLPDRILGLVSIVPEEENAKGYAVHGVLRFISGGTTGAKTLKELEMISPTHYRYGQLDIIIHDQTYTSLTGIVKPYRTSRFPATELTFSDRATEPADAGTEKTYPMNTDYRFVVEVRPTWADGNELTSVNVLGDQELIGLEAIGNTRSFQVWLNASEEDRQVSLQRNRLPIGIASYVHSEGLLGRVDYQSTVPAQATLTGGQHAVVIVSDQAEDHSFGWTSFSGMVGYPEMEVIGEKEFGKVAPNTSKEIVYKITNPNEAQLLLTGIPKIEIEGDAAFSLVEDAGLGNLSYGDTTTFKVRFTPTSEEAYSATVKIQTNIETNEVYECRLSGWGSEEILMIQSSPFGTSWERAEIWEDSLPASAGKKYLIDRSQGASTFRTPPNQSTIFPGEYLKVVNGGSILLKTAANGSIDIKKAIFSGGGMAFASGALTYNWKGEVSVEENGLGIGNVGNLMFEGPLTGDGPISVNGPDITFVAGSWNGDIVLTNGLLRFGFDLTDGRGFIYNGGNFDLNGRNHVFENLFIRGIPMPAGVYGAADLEEGFMGEGTITIKPYTTVPENLPIPNPEEILQENTLAKCTDGIDNDGDGKADCEDGDCMALNLPACEKIAIQLRFLLEGFYIEQEGRMRTDLLENGLVPREHPFSTPPFNYTGPEIATSLGDSIVDWALVEIRSGLDINTILISKAVLLTDTGKLVDTRGNLTLEFPGVTEGNYYVAVYHRGHLGIISASPLALGLTASTYDFTTATNQAKGTVQLKQVGTVFCLYAGDFDGNGLLNSLDFNVWKQNPAGINQYLPIDADGNGVINSLDFNLWKANGSKLGDPAVQK